MDYPQRGALSRRERHTAEMITVTAGAGHASQDGILCHLSFDQRGDVYTAEGHTMTFDELLTQVLDLLQREKRVSYRALKRRFDFDDDYLEDVKDELIYAKKLAVDEDNRVLVWTGETRGTPRATPIAPPPPQADVTPPIRPSQAAPPPAEPPLPEAERRH